MFAPWLILGIGMPTAGDYLLVAISFGPALVKMGVPLLQAHLFVFLFATFSHLTPPVAMGALVASRIAGTSYWNTAVESVKVAFVAFLLPFFIIYVPVLILRPQGGLELSVIQIIAAFAVVLTLQAVITGYLYSPLSPGKRLILSLIAVGFIMFIITQSYLSFAVGIALYTGVTFLPPLVRRYWKPVST